LIRFDDLWTGTACIGKASHGWAWLRFRQVEERRGKVRQVWVWLGLRAELVKARRKMRVLCPLDSHLFQMAYGMEGHVVERYGVAGQGYVVDRRGLVRWVLVR